MQYGVRSSASCWSSSHGFTAMTAAPVIPVSRLTVPGVGSGGSAGDTEPSALNDRDAERRGGLTPGGKGTASELGVGRDTRSGESPLQAANKRIVSFS